MASPPGQARLAAAIPILILVLVCHDFAHSKPTPNRKPPFNGSIFGKRSAGPPTIERAPGPVAPLAALGLGPPGKLNQQQQQQPLQTDEQKAAKGIVSMVLAERQRDQDHLVKQRLQRQLQLQAAIQALASRCLVQDDELLSELEVLDYCEELLAFLSYEPAARRLEQLVESAD